MGQINRIQHLHPDVLDLPKVHRPLCPKDIFLWWEGRRWSYTRKIGLIGLVYAVIGLVPYWYVSQDFFEPFSVVVGACAGYLIAANCCFFIGPLIECLFFWCSADLEDRALADNLYQIGSALSLVLTFIVGSLMILVAFSLVP
ncbi:MAG: hypothetical protein AAF598_01100 [Bacteroidota bacterium]